MKDCKIIFTNKQTYEFESKDLAKALEYAKNLDGEKGVHVWAIKTPWGVLQPMDEETFENVSTCVFDGGTEDGASYALD